MARGSRRESGEQPRRPSRELSVGYVFLAWGVFILLWIFVGFIVALIVFAVMIAAGVGAFRLR